MARDAYLHLARPPAPGAPLVFALHGTGGDEHQFAPLVARLAPGAGLVAPRGDVDEGGAARFFRRRAEGVYDMADLARATGKMAGFVAAHRAAHPEAPAFGLGYSNGANILAAVLLARPALFAGAALLHPLIPWQPEPQPGLAGLPILVTAGRQDPICPWPLTESFLAYLESQGARLSRLVHPGGHEMRAEELDAAAEALEIAAPTPET